MRATLWCPKEHAWGVFSRVRTLPETPYIGVHSAWHRIRSIQVERWRLSLCTSGVLCRAMRRLAACDGM